MKLKQKQGSPESVGAWGGEFLWVALEVRPSRQGANGEWSVK